MAWLTLCVVWSSTWLVIKIGLRDLPPISYAAIRFVLAVIVLLAVSTGRVRLLPQRASDYPLTSAPGPKRSWAEGARRWPRPWSAWKRNGRPRLAPGYPKGLHEDEIPLGSRIFTVVDTFDSMTSDRPYRQALSARKALDEILRCGGSQFDPLVVEAFLDIYEKWVIERDRMHAPKFEVAA